MQLDGGAEPEPSGESADRERWYKRKWREELDLTLSLTLTQTLAVALTLTRYKRKWREEWAHRCAAQGPNPRRAEDPRQACYSHVRASPRTAAHCSSASRACRPSCSRRKRRCACCERSYCYTD